MKFDYSIITPTYNRQSLLPNLYQSILLQKNINIEWLIIDDCSTDDTNIIIKSFKDTENLKVNYIRLNENGGKARAVNKGIEVSKGDFITVIDSDDVLLPNKLEIVLNKYLKNIPNSVCAVCAIKESSNSNIQGNKIVNDYIDCLNWERDKFDIKGEKQEFLIGSVLKNNLFPVIDGEKFLPESVLYNSMCKKGYLFRFVNFSTTYCEYLEDGLTKNKLSLWEQNPIGHALYCKDLLLIDHSFNNKYKIFFYYYHVHQQNVSVFKICSMLNIKKINVVFFFSRRFLGKMFGKK